MQQKKRVLINLRVLRKFLTHFWGFLVILATDKKSIFGHFWSFLGVFGVFGGKIRFFEGFPYVISPPRGHPAAFYPKNGQNE